ncbi:MAG: helix-turn-helix transcriptional regulator [Kiritimatiellae bacterium]|nr:helix-turn-helix transcriptional regulator [Kiritimatiellia bacterium]
MIAIPKLELFMETFGERLESLRGSVSQRDFARNLGVPLTSYTNWVCGTSSPKMEYIVMLCTKLGISADWLLGLPERGVGARVEAGKGAAVSIGSGTATASNCRDCPILLDFIKRRSGG